MDYPVSNRKSEDQHIRHMLGDVGAELQRFEQSLLNHLDQLEKHTIFNTFLLDTSSTANQLLELSIDLSERGFAKLQSMNWTLDNWSSAIPSYLFTFKWPQLSKSYFILFRDVLMECEKANVSLHEDQIELAKVKQLQVESVQALRSHWSSIKVELEKEQRAIVNNKEAYFTKWTHEYNPWPELRSQLYLIKGQIKDLGIQNIVTGEANEMYHNIRHLIKETLDNCLEQLDRVHKHSNETILFFATQSNDQDPALKNKIEEVQQLVNFPNRIEGFLSQLETYLDALPEKMRLATKGLGGKLLVKDFSFSSLTRQWIESEILPLVYEYWELIDRANNGIKVSLLNISNRLTLHEKELLENGSAEIKKENLSQPLKLFMENEKIRKDRMQNLYVKISSKMNEHFQLSNCFSNTKYFIGDASNINQLRIEQNPFWNSIKHWSGFALDWFRKFWKSVEEEELLSDSEKIARAIEQRKGDSKNVQYKNIFLTSGYLGESFVVGRKVEFDHIEKVIKQWDLGFRGAVLLCGPRFCGKTLFGEMVASKFFHRKTIRIEPNATLVVEGRRLKVATDLKPALEFVKKYTLNQRPLIWIDDLELWKDANIPFAQNLIVLEKFISEHSGRMFFMVATSRSAFKLYDKTYKLSQTFQAVLNLSKMSEDEIKEAILIRHGATHKNLVNENGNVITPSQFNKYTERSISEAKNNIGETFFSWSSYLSLKNADEVEYQERSKYALPNFVDANIGILLATIHLEKNTNEYQLRKKFGPAFNEKYRALLQRLIRTKVVIRKADGWLRLNDLIANELVYILEKGNYLIK